MKKVLLFLGLAISTVSFGQKKGDKFVSGTVSYTKTTDVDGILAAEINIESIVEHVVSNAYFIIKSIYGEDHPETQSYNNHYKALNNLYHKNL